MQGRKGGDRLRTCHGLNSHKLAIGGAQLLAYGASGWRHGKGIA
jgi:hypothetical protein